MVIKTEVLIKDNKQKYRRAYDKIKFKNTKKMSVINRKYQRKRNPDEKKRNQ